MSLNFEFDVHENYSNYQIENGYEQERDAIYFSAAAASELGGTYSLISGISPTQARELAKALNEQADAYDEREKARQEAKKYPQEDGYYLVGSFFYNKSRDWYLVNGGLADPIKLRERIDQYGYKKMTVED
jgi:hypothetical protein